MSDSPIYNFEDGQISSTCMPITSSWSAPDGKTCENFNVCIDQPSTCCDLIDASEGSLGLRASQK